MTPIDDDPLWTDGVHDCPECPHTAYQRPQAHELDVMAFFRDFTGRIPGYVARRAMVLEARRARQWTGPITVHRTPLADGSSQWAVTQP